MNEDVQKAIELMQQLSEILQMEFGWLIGGTRNIVNYPNNPNNAEIRPMIQKRVNALVDGSLLLYLFAIWDDIVTDTIKSLMMPDERKKLRAYKHIRHSVGHRFSGGRADMYRGEFEELYDARVFPSLTWDRSEDTLDLSNGNTAYECQQFMAKLAQQLTARAAKAEIDGVL